MKKKFIKFLISVALIGAVSLGGYFGYKTYAASKKPVQTTRYITTTIKKSNLELDINGTGTVVAASTKDIVANNSGIVQDLNIKVGDTVKQGDKIATINSDDINQAVSKATLTLQQQQLQLQKAKTDVDTQMQNLVVEQAQNDLNSKISQQSKMNLTSPVGGLVIAKNNANGDNVQAGKVLATIADTSSLKIQVSVDELDIAKVKVGQKSTIKFDALKNKNYEGTVEEIAQTGTTTNNVTTYQVTVNINNPEGVKIGMNANVSILVESKQNVLAVPVEAVTERNGNKYVMIPNANYGNRSTTGNVVQNQGRLIKITTGLENENFIEVTDGIKEGDSVMIMLPQSSTNNSRANMRNGFGGGSFGGNFGGTGGTRSASGSNSKKN